MGAGLDEATASRFDNMALYAAYAVNALVRQSGKAAFTWVPLQGTVLAAADAVSEAGRAAFTQAFIAALSGVSRASLAALANLLVNLACKTHANSNQPTMLKRLVRATHKPLA